MSSSLPPKSKLWLLITMRWQVYRLARLVGKVFRFQHRGTHWWAAPLCQKLRNRSGLNNWLDCLASWYTSNFNLCILQIVKWWVSFAGFHQFSRLTVTGIWEGIQWVPRGKQRLPHCCLSPNCVYILLAVFIPVHFLYKFMWKTRIYDANVYNLRVIWIGIA